MQKDFENWHNVKTKLQKIQCRQVLKNGMSGVAVLA
jgi:hypothetical protein